jgi:prevent-host-death family protein
MGLQINIAEAQARLAELLARAEAGEDVIIARGGRPSARLVPLQPQPRPEPPPRRPGLASHWRNDPDWDRLNKALLEPMSEEIPGSPLTCSLFTFDLATSLLFPRSWLNDQS